MVDSLKPRSTISLGYYVLSTKLFISWFMSPSNKQDSVVAQVSGVDPSAYQIVSSFARSVYAPKPCSSAVLQSVKIKNEDKNAPGCVEVLLQILESNSDLDRFDVAQRPISLGIHKSTRKRFVLWFASTKYQPTVTKWFPIAVSLSPFLSSVHLNSNETNTVSGKIVEQS